MHIVENDLDQLLKERKIFKFIFFNATVKLCLASLKQRLFIVFAIVT